MKILKFKDREGEEKEVKINASALSVVLYDKEFSSDLQADWGMVEYKTGRYLMVNAAYNAVNTQFNNFCAEQKIDPNDDEALRNLILSGNENASALANAMILAEKEMNENYSLEAATFYQIVYILDKSQRKIDSKEEISFEGWLIKYADMTVLENLEAVKEEMKNVFSSGGMMEAKA